MSDGPYFFKVTAMNGDVTEIEMSPEVTFDLVSGRRRHVAVPPGDGEPFVADDGELGTRYLLPDRAQEADDDR